MRKLLSLSCLIVFLALAVPAQAQLRKDVNEQQAQTRLYGGEVTGFLLNKLFSPQHFRMSHSYEMSVGGFGGNTSSLGMYTNTMMFQFNQKLAARVDVSFAHSPFGGNNYFGHNIGNIGDNGRVFLRNAEVVYRPSENTRFHFSFRQSPYGGYMGPYGHYGYNPYRYRGSSFGLWYDDYGDDLFWNDGLR